jgi:hypothetical protein
MDEITFPPKAVLTETQPPQQQVEETPHHDQPEEKLVINNCITLTLLLISGLRSTIVLDSDYITHHSLHVSKPEWITIQSLKDGLFNSWKDEWGNLPPSTQNIRLIHLGKILEESQTLEDCGITPLSVHNVIHLTVKPESFELEAPTKSRPAFRRRNNANSNSDERSRGCCVIS